MKIALLLFVFLLGACGHPHSAPVPGNTEHSESERISEPTAPPSVKPPEVESGSVSTGGGIDKSSYLKWCVSEVATKLLELSMPKGLKNMRTLTNMRWLADEANDFYKVRESEAARGTDEGYKITFEELVMIIALPPSQSCDTDLESEFTFTIIRIAQDGDFTAATPWPVVRRVQ